MHNYCIRYGCNSRSKDGLCYCDSSLCLGYMAPLTKEQIDRAVEAVNFSRFFNGAVNYMGRLPSYEEYEQLKKDYERIENSIRIPVYDKEGNLVCTLLKDGGVAYGQHQSNVTED